MKGSSRIVQVCSICIMGLLCLLGMQAQAQAQAQAQEKVGVLYVVHGGFDEYSERNLFDSSAQLFAVRPDHIVHQIFLWNKGGWQGILAAGNAPKEIIKYSFNYGRLGGVDPFHTLIDNQVVQLEAELNDSCGDTTFVVDYASWMAGDRPENYPYPRFIYNPPPWIVPDVGLSEGNISEFTYCGEQETFGTSLDFKNGSAAFSAGATLTGSSGARALIEDVEVYEGSWAGGDAEGRLYLKNLTYQAGACAETGNACTSASNCGFLESCLGDYFDVNDAITDGAGGAALSAGKNRWADCDPYRFDVDGPAERFIDAGVDRIVIIDMTTGAVRFFKTWDVIWLFKRALADKGRSDIPVDWVNDPNDLMDRSYPSAPTGVRGDWTSDLSYSSGNITDVSVPLTGNPNPVTEDMELAELLVEGIEANMVPGQEATTGIVLLNHATRDWDQYWDPKINDTVAINQNIKSLLLSRYPDMDPANIVGSWMGVQESGTAEGGPAKERTRNMRGENLGHAWLYEQPNETRPGGEWGYLYWQALEYLKNRGVTHIVIGFPQIVTNSVLNLVEVHNQIGKEIGKKNWLYWDTPDNETYPGVGHPFADYWGIWANTNCGEWKLNYNTGTQAFVVNRTITGQTSGATGLIFAKTGTTATGTLTLKKVSGTFVHGESILGSGTNGGIAKANGTQSLTVKQDCCFTMGGCGDPLRPYPPPRQTPKARDDMDPSLAYDVSDYGHLGYDETGASGPVDPDGPVQSQYDGTWAMYSPPNDDPRLAALLAKHVRVALGSACDDPPALTAGPFLAAGNWPVLPTSAESPMYLDQNYSVLWKFSDDFASCSGDCTHAAEYQAVGGSSWSSLDVTVNAAKGIARVTLPVESLQNATTYAFRYSVTDCASQTTQSAVYYFRVAITDAPPVIKSGPWLAAGSWPLMATSSAQATVLDENVNALWKFSDDYSFCSGLCTHRARYKKVDDTVWTWITPVSTDSTGKKYAYTELPVVGLEAGTYQFYFDVLDCNGQRTYATTFYYFKVE